MKNLAFFLFVILLSSCAGSKPDKPLIFIKNYKFSITPGTIETNGYIYGENRKTGAHVFITKLQVPSEEGPISIPKEERKIQIEFKSLLKWIGDTTVFKAENNIVLNKDVELELELINANELQTPLLGASSMISGATKAISEELDKKILLIEDYKFFIINKTVQVKKMNYVFLNKIDDNINFNIIVQKVISGKPEYKLVKNDKISLNFDGDISKAVLFDTFPLLINKSLTGGYDIKIGSQANK